MTAIVKDLSVVVCTLNEEKRLEECLRSIILNEPGEIIVVDGGSKDNTVQIARQYTKNIINTEKSNLTRDRQIGIDATTKEYIAMIDSDHRLKKNDLASLLFDLEKYNFDIVQSQLTSFKNNNYWNAAEEQAWALAHNIPGPKNMIGVAPAIFKKSLFDKIRFDDKITKTIDDTDFMYRLSKLPEMRFGIGDTTIKQLHFGTFNSYVKKFKWYGYGDGEFCVKHSRRIPSMLFHLLIRYPMVYSVKAVLKGKFKVVPYFILQGYVRFYGLIVRVVQLTLRGLGGRR